MPYLATVVTGATLLSSLSSLFGRFAFLSLSTLVPEALAFLALPGTLSSFTLPLSCLLAVGFALQVLGLALPTFQPPVQPRPWAVGRLSHFVANASSSSCS